MNTLRAVGTGLFVLLAGLLYPLTSTVAQSRVDRPMNRAETAAISVRAMRNIRRKNVIVWLAVIGR